MIEMNRSLTILVHGPSKSGKSTLAVTSPGPRLLLDVETGHRFLPGINYIYWDPKKEKAPVPDGTWDTVVVNVLTWADVESAYRFLKLGDHHFKSVIIDSVSELQTRLIDNIAGTDQMRMQHWGTLLRSMGDILRGFRDLTMHPTNPLEAVVLTAMSQELGGKYRPFMQGQIKTQISYWYDLVGYLRIEEFANPDPTLPSYKVRRLYVEATDFAEAGERVQGRLGSIVEQADLSVMTMLDRVYGTVSE